MYQTSVPLPPPIAPHPSKPFKAIKSAFKKLSNHIKISNLQLRQQFKLEFLPGGFGEGEKK
jgi:hypothetical protein